MASLRSGTRRDGSTYVQVLYRLNGKQSSTSFEDLASATKFQKLVEKFGPAKALETLYVMSCVPNGGLITCTGGNNAVVYIY